MTFGLAQIAQALSLLTEKFFKVRGGNYADIRSALRRRDKKRATAFVMYDIVGFDFVYLSRLFVERAKVAHIVGRQRKDKRVLRHVYNRHRLSCSFGRSRKVFDRLRNDDFHTVILSYALCELVHKIERNGVFLVDK